MPVSITLNTVKGTSSRLFILFVTAFVDMVGLTMILPLFPFYATEMGASPTDIGLLISAFSVAQLVAAPVWGRFSDHYGRRPVILGGLLITGLAYLLFAWAGSLWVLLISRIVQGVGGGTIGVVQAYVADASPPERRVRSLGWLSAVTSLGAVAGPAFGSLMIWLGGHRTPGLAAAVLAVLVAGFGWKYLKESREPVADPESGPPAVATPARAAALGILTRWSDPASRLIWIYAIAIGAFYGTGQLSPLLLDERFGITAETAGYFIMYLGGVGVIVRSLVLGPAVDRLGEAGLSRLGIVLLATGLGLTGLATNFAVLAIGFSLMPFGTAFLFPCVTGMLSRVVPARERGLYMGLQHTFGGVSRVAFPLLAGLSMDRFGVGVPFWISGLCVLITLPLVLPGAGMPGKVET